MDILLINPSIRPESEKLLWNMGLVYIASELTRNHYDIEIVDIDAHRHTNDEFEEIIKNKKFDVLGIGDLVSDYKWFKQATLMIKKHHPNATIIAGNTVATSIPEILLERTGTDIVVYSEGERTIIELLRALGENKSIDEIQGIGFVKNGKTVKTSDRPIIEPIDSIPFPNFKLFDWKKYLGKSKINVNAADVVEIPYDDIVSMPLVSARGCLFNCTFCYHAFNGKKYRHRTAQNIVDEIHHLKNEYGANFISFWDELSFYSPNQARETAKRIIKDNLNICWYGTCRSGLINSKNEEIAHLMKEAGCRGISFSLENGDQDILNAMDKKATPDQFVEQAQIFQKAGIPVFTSLVFGYPQETPQTIKKTFDVLRKARVFPSVGYLLPLPGSTIFNYALERGYIQDIESYLLGMGDRQDLRVNLTKMSDDEFMENIHHHLRELNNFLDLELDENKLIKTTNYKSALSKTNPFAKTDKVTEKAFSI